MSLISVRDLTKTIGNKKVLNRINFEFDEGKVVGVLGPNGAGKTTLLKMLVNIYHADSGEVYICGEKAGFATKKYISFLPDINHLFPWMRVRDAINYYSDMFEDFDLNRSNELCSFLGIMEDEKIQNLSKGSREQVLIMLTFSRCTPLYVLDEPIGGVDPLARQKIIKTVFTGLNDNSTVIISTHQVKDVEVLLDNVLFINQGELIFSDSADNIREVHGKSIEECYLEVFQNA